MRRRRRRRRQRWRRRRAPVFLKAAVRTDERTSERTVSVGTEARRARFPVVGYQEWPRRTPRLRGHVIPHVQWMMKLRIAPGGTIYIYPNTDRNYVVNTLLSMYRITIISVGPYWWSVVNLGWLCMYVYECQVGEQFFPPHTFLHLLFMFPTTHNNYLPYRRFSLPWPFLSTSHT